MKVKVKWSVAGIVIFIIVVAAVLIIAIQESKNIEFNNERYESLTAGLNDYYSNDEEYCSFHIKYYGSKWAGFSTRLFITGSANCFYKSKTDKKIHWESEWPFRDIFVIDTVIDGNDVKIKSVEALTDEDMAVPTSEGRSKIPQEIYYKMNPEDPEKYLKEDTQNAREYFKAME